MPSFDITSEFNNQEVTNAIDQMNREIINRYDFKDTNTSNWKFLQSNDLNTEYILKKFPKLRDGIDVLYIDSYHDVTHVKKTLEKWFIYVKKNFSTREEYPCWGSNPESLD